MLVPFYFFIAGLLVGSFINAAEYRLATGKPVGLALWRKERSQCTSCNATLQPMDLVPVVSFIWLRGRCRSCAAPISIQYPLVELATAIAAAFVAWQLGWGWEAVFVAVFSAVLVFLFLYDLKHQLILDIVTIPAMIFAVVVAVVLQKDLYDLLLGMLIGGGFFALQYLVSRGRWIGAGDIRFGLLVGLMLGWQGTVATLFIAYVGGACIALGLIAVRHVGLKSRLPFGVFLSAAAFIVLLYGDALIQWYLNLILL